MKITANKISATAAHQKLQEGGYNFIIFHGDEVDFSDLYEFAGVNASDEDQDERSFQEKWIDDLVARLGVDEALELNVEV